jgi:energy-coupling factor transport system ATP-binding protein
MYGPTGSGKSTLLKQMKKQIKPFGKISGEVLYCGKNIDGIGDLTSVCEIGFVFQNPESQIVADTVWRELAFSLENIGVKTQDMRKKIGEMACFFGLENILGKSVHELSGGQKQILNLCSVLLLQPKVLILDEPISQLDPINAKEFLKIIYQLIKDFNITVILSEHRLDDVYFLADKIIILEEGKIKYTGAPDVTANNTKNEENLKNFLPELTKLYFSAGKNTDTDTGVILKTMREYKSWLKKFDVRTVGRSDPDAPSEICVSLKDIYFSYAKKDRDILSGLNLSANSGEIISVMGGNGAGKTTLFKIMAGVLKPQRGKIEFTQTPAGIAGAPFQKGAYSIGYLSQNPKAYFMYDTVEKEIFERVKSLKADKKYAEYLIDLFKIENILKLHPYDISGGEQQLAAFCTVMLKNPGILLLDEPTKGLDPNIKKSFFELLRVLKNEGRAIIIATHDMEFAAKYSDSCCFLFDGEIISKYPPDKFFSENYFYTTAVNKLFRDIITGDGVPHQITRIEDVILNDLVHE